MILGRKYGLLAGVSALTWVYIYPEIIKKITGASPNLALIVFGIPAQFIYAIVLLFR